MSSQTLSLIKVACGGAEAFEAIKNRIVFFCSDNAADELKCARLLRAGGELPNMNFIVQDTTHSISLAIKNGVKGDPEVDAVQKALLTSKRPRPSLSNFLRNSKRFQAAFTKEQQEDCLSVLQHLSWAPQRHASRARAYGRIAVRIKQVFQALVAAVALEPGWPYAGVVRCSL